MSLSVCVLQTQFIKKIVHHWPLCMAEIAFISRIFVVSFLFSSCILSLFNMDVYIKSTAAEQQQQQHNSNKTNFIYIFQMLFSRSHAKRWHIDLVLNIIAILCTNNIINVLETFRHGPLLIRIHCWPNKRRMSITTRFQVLKPVHVISKKLPGSIWYFLRNIVTDLKSCSVFVLSVVVVFLS